MRKLNLDQLKEGLPGVTKSFGAFLAEAAMYCLEENGHQGTVQLKVTGHFEETFELIWTDKVTEDVKSTWYDVKEATEYAATAIAMLIIPVLTDFDLFKRTRGGTDYVLGKTKSTAQNSPLDISYLEISGLWKEASNNTINMRVNLKKKQVKRTVIDAPSFIVVTAFNLPKTKIVKL